MPSKVKQYTAMYDRSIQLFREKKYEESHQLRKKMDKLWFTLSPSEQSEVCSHGNWWREPQMVDPDRFRQVVAMDSFKKLHGIEYEYEGICDTGDGMGNIHVYANGDVVSSPYNPRVRNPKKRN